MEYPDLDLETILGVLVAREVDFIIVGGVCAVLHGAPVATFDLDVVHSRKPENLDRLLLALTELGAYYRGQGHRRLEPKATYLASPGHHLLVTRAGPLDLLGTIGTDLGYEELLQHTSEMTVGRGSKVRVLNLARLIEIKEEIGRDKDNAVLPVLRRTLEEKSSTEGNPT